MYKAFKLQPHPCALYDNKNMIIQENLLFLKTRNGFKHMNWFKSIPIEIILSKIPKEHLSKIKVIDVSWLLNPLSIYLLKLKDGSLQLNDANSTLT